MTLAEVSKILRVDMEKFFIDFTNLITNYNQIFIDYYTLERDYPKEGFDLLDSLLERCVTIKQNVKIRRNSLSGFFAWETLDSFEDCYKAMDTIENYSRWLRTSFTNGRFKESVEVTYILRKNQTLEQLSDEIGFSNRERGGLELALRNDIRETDYTLEGGLSFKFSYQNDESIYLNTVIDNLTGRNVLGKDIAKKFQFVENDILILPPDDTFQQTCAILTGLLKNNNPEFPDQGFDKTTLSNKNVLGNTLPTFIRQLYSTVSRDDTVASFQVLNVSMVGDSLQIEMEFRSHLDTEVKQTANGN